MYRAVNTSLPHSSRGFPPQLWGPHEGSISALLTGCSYKLFEEIELRVKFIRVSLIQIVSRILGLQQRAQPLTTPFSFPCKPVQLIIVSRVVARQYGIKYNNIILCSNGAVYGSTLFDISSSSDIVETARYLLCTGFEIRGRTAYILKYLLRRSSGIVVEEHPDKVTVLYSP